MEGGWGGAQPLSPWANEQEQHWPGFQLRDLGSKRAGRCGGGVGSWEGELWGTGERGGF